MQSPSPATKRKFALFSILVCLFMTTVMAQQGGSDVVIKPNKVRESFYMLEGRGGNIAMLSNADGVLIVDTQFPQVAPKILKTIGELSDGKLQYVLNTHFHGDHTGGNAVLGAGATIVGHNRVRERLASNSNTPSTSYPDITYTRQMQIYFGEEEIHLLHLGPGHTDTDSVIHFRTSNVIHTGDLFFNGRFPYIDLGSGGSVRGYLSNIRIIAGLCDEDTVIIPGHGNAARKSDLLNFITMFEECLNIVSSAKDAGQSLEQITAKGLPEKYREWGEAFINESRWISFLYEGS